MLRGQDATFARALTLAPHVRATISLEVGGARTGRPHDSRLLLFQLRDLVLSEPACAGTRTGRRGVEPKEHSVKQSLDVGAAIRTWDKQKANFIQTLDLHLEHVDHGEARMRMPFRPQVLNQAGAVHGGAIVSLCDTSFYVALASLYGPMQPTATASLTCSFLRPALRAARLDRACESAQAGPPHRLR